MHHYRTLVAACLLFLLPLSGQAAWKSDGSLKIAVLDIDSRVENESIDPVTISEMLQARLVDTKRFTIVERALLTKILEEHQLRMLGLTDADASAVGALAGADKILAGSLSRLGAQYVILVKGIDTKTGIVELSDQVMSADTEGIAAAMERLADRIVIKARGGSVDEVSVPQRRERVVLDERFRDNRNGWSVGEWESAAADLTNGKYVIRMKSTAPIFYSKIDVVAAPGTDYRIDATVVKLSGAEENLSYYGVIFGNDFKNMYEFLVHPNGKCMIREQRKGETIFVQPSATTAAVRRGNAPNDLRIEREGGLFKFFLNDQLMAQHRPEAPPGNAFLIGYEVWRTEGEKMSIAGTKFTVSQIEALGADVPAGVVTAWMGAEAFGKEMDRRWKDGYYPAQVEGKNRAGRSEFRAILNPFPKRVWWFYWWYGQELNSYEDHKKRMTAEGFREINLQVFTDQDGTDRYQTCWIKYGPQ